MVGIQRLRFGIARGCGYARQKSRVAQGYYATQSNMMPFAQTSVKDGFLPAISEMLTIYEACLFASWLLIILIKRQSKVVFSYLSLLWNRQ